MKKRILAIDDSKAIRFLLQTVLGRSYQVITVPDGYAAMYYLTHREQPDLIIADPQLPDMEDWELIHQLSGSGMYGNIPLLVLSGFDKNETESRCVEYGAAGHFLKPFNPVEVIECIEALLVGDRSDRSLPAMAG